MYKKICRNMSFISVFALLLTAITVYFACHGAYSRRLEAEIKETAMLVADDVLKGDYSVIGDKECFADKNITLFRENGELVKEFGSPDINPVSEFDEYIKKAKAEGEAEKAVYSPFDGKSRYSFFMVLESGEILCVTAKTYDAYIIFAGAFLPAVIIAFLIYILSNIISVRLTENIVKPIEEIDPLNEEEYEKVYDEIKPFLKRISDQNKKIKEQMKTLSETEKIRREFSANVSHELKTPLTTIHGYAQLINSGMAKKEDIPEFTKKIEKETKRLINLTEDITKLSKLDENIETPGKEKLNLKELAIEVKEKLMEMADERDIDFYVTGDDFFIEANYNQITELIYNLCENAIKYNKENGSVRVIISENTLTVRDTGIGIPKEDLNRIYERFFRVDKSHSKTVQGTGLGLSIVKHIALINKADITVESELGKGTEFKVVFNK